MRAAPWYTESRRPKRSVNSQANSAGTTATRARPRHDRASRSESSSGLCGSSASSGTESARIGRRRRGSISRAQNRSASGVEVTSQGSPVTGSPNCLSSSTEASRAASSGTFGSR